MPLTPDQASSGHITTVPYHKTSWDKTGSLAMTSHSMTRILPPTENAYKQREDTQGSSETARETGIRMNPNLKEGEKMPTPSQAEGVECDWQTVFWRLPTPQRSNNHIVASSAEAIVSSQTSAVGPKSSFSGLESHLAEDEAVTLGEKLAGETIWGKNEDLKLPELHLIVKEKDRAASEGFDRSLFSGGGEGRERFHGVRAKL